MNLSDRQRKLVFGGLVVVLAAVGVYLTVAAPDHDSGADPAPSARPTATPTGPTGPASPPPGIATPVSPGGFDIYRLLPFSQAEFGTAADLAQRFTAAYGTFRFDEDPKTYIGRLAPMVTGELRAELERGATAPGLIEDRRQQQTVATGGATLDRVRDIEDNSVIFLVTGKQEVTEGGKKTQKSEQYAVTVARDGGSLKVYSFAPADAGQQGDTG
ncbi:MULTISPECIES: conjugal transfer protein [Actinomadura]|uniref:Conjugal transfer protein n=1 Tax=Actinomadura yumaensis TaxID=111807 RepID=A0ABW2C9R3_9ACTN|nr:conjugal transfer protein [Actinomadura sp. J1-007]MWK33908.1 hypothetical protein [Actinomadura sp. J1-007]